MNVLILQHAAVEHPGIFLDFFREDGFRWMTVELDEGKPIPELNSFDLMLVMGGSQDVWQEDQYPWLRQEKAAIRNRGRYAATLSGICLGHQLLADAIGGLVRLAKSPEVGVMTVSRTRAGHRESLLRALPDPMTVLQWHGWNAPISRQMGRYSQSRRLVAFRHYVSANTLMAFSVISK